MLKPQGPRRTWRRLVWIVASVAGVLLLVVAAVGVYLGSLAGTFDSKRHIAAPAFPASRPPAATGRAAGAVNILLLGIDGNSTEARKAGLSSTRAADMVAVVHIPASRDRLYLMSILRNSLVTLPGVGRAPISAAFAEGGIPLQVQAVESLVGVRMDHVVAVSVPGLKGLTDALGGVTVRNGSAFANQGHSFRAGTQKLDGSAAVAFVRRGGAVAAADTDRAQAQEAYVRGVLEQLLSARTLLNPAAMSAVVSVLSPYLTVDAGLDAATVADLGVGLRDVRSDDISLFRMPTSGQAKVGPVDLLKVDAEELATIRRQFRRDSLDEYVP